MVGPTLLALSATLCRPRIHSTACFTASTKHMDTVDDGSDSGTHQEVIISDLPLDHVAACEQNLLLPVTQPVVPRSGDPPGVLAKSTAKEGFPRTEAEGIRSRRQSRTSPLLLLLLLSLLILLLVLSLLLSSLMLLLLLSV